MDVLEKIKSLFRKKQKKNILYSGYVSKKQKEQQEKEEIQEKKEKVVEIKVNKTILIGVCNLQGSIGASYIAKALLQYIETALRKQAGIFDLTSGSPDYTDRYDEYDYIILDCGDFGTLSMEQKRELKRTDIKLLLTLLDEEYLIKLADFVREEPGQWKFIFNHVPKNKLKKVEDLMEGYEYYCFSAFDSQSLKKDEKMIMKRILGG